MVAHTWYKKELRVFQQFNENLKDLILIATPRIFCKNLHISVF